MGLGLEGFLNQEKLSSGGGEFVPVSCVINLSVSSTDVVKCLSPHHGSKLFSSFPWQDLFILVSRFSSAVKHVTYLRKCRKKFCNPGMEELVFYWVCKL